jgi:hypothetical protein
LLDLVTFIANLSVVCIHHLRCAVPFKIPCLYNDVNESLQDWLSVALSLVRLLVATLSVDVEIESVVSCDSIRMAYVDKNRVTQDEEHFDLCVDV